MEIFVDGNEYTSIGYAETLSEIDDVIILYLLNEGINLDIKHLYGFPKYYVDRTNMIIDYGIENINFVVESIFS